MSAVEESVSISVDYHPLGDHDQTSAQQEDPFKRNRETLGTASTSTLQPGLLTSPLSSAPPADLRIDVGDSEHKETLDAALVEAADELLLASPETLRVGYPALSPEQAGQASASPWQQRAAALASPPLGMNSPTLVPVSPLQGGGVQLSTDQTLLPLYSPGDSESKRQGDKKTAGRIQSFTKDTLLAFKWLGSAKPTPDPTDSAAPSPVLTSDKKVKKYYSRDFLPEQTQSLLGGATGGAPSSSWCFSPLLRCGRRLLRSNFI